MSPEELLKGYPAASRAEETPKGFTCLTPGCGQAHVFDVYVFAHWDNQLHCKCGPCGALYHVQRGVVRISKRGRVRKTNPNAVNGSKGHST